MNIAVTECSFGQAKGTWSTGAASGTWTLSSARHSPEVTFDGGAPPAEDQQQALKGAIGALTHADPRYRTPLAASP